MQVHGGDIYNNNVTLDFSANINPFGMPESVMEAAIQGVKQSTHYPNISCDALREAIALKENVKKEEIICGNGAAELIFSLVYALKPKKAMIVAPSFLEYEQALRAGGCAVKEHVLCKEEGFELTSRILSELDESIDLMFLCNPNNPTGFVIQPQLLDQIIEECKKHDILLVLDECFQNFLQKEDQDSRSKKIAECKNLFILKAFTKMYGMAGLRLGYGLSSNQELLDQMRVVVQPWNVSIPAQMAGIAACKEVEFEQNSREYIQVQREYLRNELKKLGLSVYQSKANYIFFEGPNGLYEKCLKERFLIRSCSNYKGLGDTFYRIAVKSKEENEAFIGILKKIL